MNKITRLVAPALIAVAVFAAAGPAHALFDPKPIEEILREYATVSISEKRKIVKQLGNVGLGLERANIVLESQGKARLFCPTSKKALTASHYFDILKRKIHFNTELGQRLETEVDEVLMDILLEMFPCPE